jgi:hypothetical protein
MNLLKYINYNIIYKYIMINETNIWNNECKQFKKLPHTLPKVPRVVAIGDIHGNLRDTIKIFLTAKLIDKKGNWIAKPSNTIVIQVGDQLDSCRPSNKQKCGLNDETTKKLKGDLAVFKFFYKVNKNAEKKGGKVISLLGNHEIMNVIGDFRYISKNDIEYINKLNLLNKDLNLSNKELLEIRRLLFKRGNYFAKYMACTRQSAIIIGTNLFIHAGILPELAKKFKINEINTLVRTWLLDILKLDNITNNNVKDILFNEISPFWNRILGSIPKNSNLSNDECQNYIAPVLNLWEIENMIVGHTPTQVFGNNMNSTCDNKLWRIDIGLSQNLNKNKNKNIQFLEIIDDNKFNIYEIKNNICVKSKII